MRYSADVEILKDGRKKIKQHTVVDTLTGKVLVRYADEAKAQQLANDLNAAAEE